MKRQTNDYKQTLTSKHEKKTFIRKVKLNTNEMKQNQLEIQKMIIPNSKRVCVLESNQPTMPFRSFVRLLLVCLVRPLIQNSTQRILFLRLFVANKTTTNFGTTKVHSACCIMSSICGFFLSFSFPFSNSLEHIHCWYIRGSSVIFYL